jgi:hypothetical protein
MPNLRLLQAVSLLSSLAATSLFAGCADVNTAATGPSGITLDLQTDGAGSLTFDATTQVAAQSGGTAYFFVERTGGSTGAVSVSYATGGGTAVAGTDYTAESGSLSWADGDTSVKTIAVPILDRTPSSDKETFHIDLTAPTGGATLGTYPTAVVSIKNSFTAPSTVSGFNFSPWKLTLPINEYRNGDDTYVAWTIQPSDLTDEFGDAYFYASGTKVVFYDPANGATTTPGSGSDHTRSEMRELYRGTGHDSNSDWNSSIGGTLNGVCTVDSVAPSSQEATVAQIHGQTNVFVLLDYRTTTGNVELAIYNSNSSGATKTNYTVESGVALGQTLTYQLSYSGNTVTATVNGSTISETVDSSWTGTPVYFKAGAYHSAPNTGNGAADATQVSYSSLSITH